MTESATHSPAPWDCDGMTQWYAKPHEGDEIDLIEIRAQVTEAGWNTVAFVEAIWPGAEANARRIVAAVNACEGLSTEAIEAGVLREWREALERAEFLMRRVADGDHHALENLRDAAESARAALAAAGATDSLRDVAPKLLASLKSILPYAENEARTQEMLNGPESEEEAGKAWKTIEEAQDLVITLLVGKQKTVNGLRRYSVLLRYPDYANDSGTETYYAWVEAPDPIEAVALAQRQALATNEWDDVEPNDLAPLLVTEGHHYGQPLFNKSISHQPEKGSSP